MRQSPPGAMVAVAPLADDVTPVRSGGAVNDPGLCVVASDHCANVLPRRGFPFAARAYAFHTILMDPMWSHSKFLSHLASSTLSRATSPLDVDQQMSIRPLDASTGFADELDIGAGSKSWSLTSDSAMRHPKWSTTAPLAYAPPRHDFSAGRAVLPESRSTLDAVFGALRQRQIRA